MGHACMLLAIMQCFLITLIECFLQAHNMIFIVVNTEYNFFKNVSNVWRTVKSHFYGTLFEIRRVRCSVFTQEDWVFVCTPVVFLSPVTKMDGSSLGIAGQ